MRRVVVAILSASVDYIIIIIILIIIIIIIIYWYRYMMDIDNNHKLIKNIDIYDID